jgi:hypothetical protein
MGNQLGDRYHLYLVAECLGRRPKLAIHVGPALLVAGNQFIVEPAVLRLYLKGGG